MIKKRVIGKPTPIEAKTETITEELKSMIAETVSVKIKASGEYGSWGIELFHSKTLGEGENASDVMDALVAELETKCAEFSEKQTPLNDRDLDQTEVMVGEEQLLDNSPGEEEPVEITEETIREMDKKELLAFIKEEQIDVNPKDYKKIADLAEAVIAIVFAEEDLTEDAVREMDREELIQCIADNTLEIDPADFKKTADLTEAVIEALFAEDLTPDAVREMEKAELLQLIKDEKIEVDIKSFKKVADLAEAVITILFADETGTDELGDFGDFDNTDLT